MPQRLKSDTASKSPEQEQANSDFALCSDIEHEGIFMERRQPPEEGKFFDELASLNKMAGDLAEHGQVLPETRQQVANEELTFVAEAIDAPLKTTFILEMTDEGLINERGDSFRETLSNGLRAARAQVKEKPQFETIVRRAVYEKHEGDLIEGMMRADSGPNTIVSVSPFAEEAYREYGAKAVKNMGFKPDRYVAFIRVYNKKSDSELEVVSLSVDNSDLDAFRGLFARFGVDIDPDTASDDFLKHTIQLDLSRHEQLQLPTTLVRTYDTFRELIYGTKTKAGRIAEAEIDAWQFINSQPDLIERYLDRLEAMAREDPTDLLAKKELAIGFWSALNLRLKKSRPGQLYEAFVPGNSHNHQQMLDAEILRGFDYAVEHQLQMVGCGGMLDALGGDKSLLNDTAENAISKIFNNKESSYKFDKIMYCKVCQSPPAEGDNKKACGPCGICRPCDTVLKAKPDK